MRDLALAMRFAMNAENKEMQQFMDSRFPTEDPKEVGEKSFDATVHNLRRIMGGS